MIKSSTLTIRIVALVPGAEHPNPETMSQHAKRLVWAVCLYDLHFAPGDMQPLQTGRFALWFPGDLPVLADMQDDDGDRKLLPADEALRKEILERDSPSSPEAKEREGDWHMSCAPPDVIVLAGEREAEWIAPVATDPVPSVRFISLMNTLFPELSGLPDPVGLIGQRCGVVEASGAHPGSTIARIHVLAGIIQILLSEGGLDDLIRLAS